MAGNLFTKYGTAGTFTKALASLASDTNLLAGWQTATIDNTTGGSAPYDDYVLGGKIKVGTSPTSGKQIEVWAFCSVDTSSTMVDAFGTTSALRSAQTANQKPMEMRNVATMVLDTGTTGVTYYFAGVSLRSLFGSVPAQFGLWVVHNTGVNLDSTEASHALYYVPVEGQYT